VSNSTNLQYVMTSTSDIDTITHKHEKYSYFSPKGLTLSLLVLRVFTYDHDSTLSLNDFAFFTNWFNWWSNLHCKSLLSDKFVSYYII